MTTDDLAELILNLRVRQGLTQKQFGELAGVPKSTIGKWEIGLSLKNTARLLTAIERSGKRITLRERFGSKIGTDP